MPTIWNKLIKYLNFESLLCIIVKIDEEKRTLGEEVVKNKTENIKK